MTIGGRSTVTRSVMTIRSRMSLMAADKPGGAAVPAMDAKGLSPGQHLRAEIRRLGLDQIAVSQAAGVSRQSINNIVNGRQRISRAMAAKLGRLTGHSSDYWLRASFPLRQAARGGGDGATGGILVDHQIIRAVKEGILRIDPFIEPNVKATSIELTLADIVIAGKGGKAVSGVKELLLSAGATAQVSTKEQVDLPRDYMARAGATARLSRSGIVTSLGLCIEPGFKGRLRFSLFNAGTAPFRLRAGEPVVSLEITRLAPPPS